MSGRAFDAIKAGLEDAIDYAKGDLTRGDAHHFEVPAVDVRAVREQLDMSQERFAETFMVSVGTVRNWEQGRRVPEGPARVLLQVIRREPKAVLRALRRMQAAESDDSAA